MRLRQSVEPFNIKVIKEPNLERRVLFMDRIDISQIPYGALDYYQVHYVIIAKNRIYDNAAFLARCYPVTKGHFTNKEIVDVKWDGSQLANILEADLELKEILRQILHEEGELKVDPLEDHIRIYGKWKNEDQLRFNPKTFDAIHKIAGHIRKLLNV